MSVENVSETIREGFEKEVLSKIQRIRNQLQVMSIAVTETAMQLTELTDSLSYLVTEINNLRSELREMQKLKNEIAKLKKEKDGDEKQAKA